MSVSSSSSSITINSAQVSRVTNEFHFKRLVKNLQEFLFIFSPCFVGVTCWVSCYQRPKSWPFSSFAKSLRKNVLYYLFWTNARDHFFFPPRPQDQNLSTAWKRDGPEETHCQESSQENMLTALYYILPSGVSCADSRLWAWNGAFGSLLNHTQPIIENLSSAIKYHRNRLGSRPPIQHMEGGNGLKFCKSYNIEGITLGLRCGY